MRVLVLGGNRYIGLHLVRELAGRGDEVTVLNSHVVPLPNGVQRLHGNRRRPGVLQAVLDPVRDQFDAVFDNTAYRVPDLEPLVELFRDRIQHFVFTSSVAVYRRSYVQPVSEGSRTHDPADPDARKSYAVGKVQCENYLADEHRVSGFPSTSLRVTHTLGRHSPSPTRDPGFFARLEAGRPILVPGEGFPFIHLVHVADVAACMASLLGSANAPGQTYNVAGGEITSVLGAVHLMARAVGVEPKVVHIPMGLARQAQPALVHWSEALLGGTVFATDKALRELDWRPRVGLEAGYRDSYEWFRSGGRDQYQFDFGPEDRILAQLGG